jgi:hypothetical protein
MNQSEDQQPQRHLVVAKTHLSVVAMPAKDALTETMLLYQSQGGSSLPTDMRYDLSIDHRLEPIVPNAAKRLGQIF